MNYFTLLEQQKRQVGGKNFVIIENEPYTYEQIYTKCVDNYRHVDLSTGTVVLINSADLLFQLTAFLGLQSLGAVPIIAHYDLPPKAIEEVMRRNKIRYQLTDIPVNYLRRASETAAGQLYEIPDIANEPLPVSVCMGALSSGSTGVPKALYRTFESWSSFFTVQNNVFKISSSSTLFLEGSLSFTGNLNLLADVLYLGAIVVLTTRFRCKIWLEMIEKYHVDVVYLVPAKLRLLAKACREMSCLTVKCIVSGSQLLSDKVGQQLSKACPSAEIILYYGASELNYISWINYRDIKNRPSSVGRPFNGVDVSVKDGLIYVDSPWFVEGACRPATVQDTGSVDGNGYIIFGGRAAAIVNKGGYKVNCFRVENAIKEHSAVRDAVVIGYAEEGHGWQLAAFIESETVTRVKLQSFLTERLARQELPRRYVFVSEIPLNSRGKPEVSQLKKILNC